MDTTILEPKSYLEILSDLAHKLRTDLAVILNDLTYFQSLLPAGETDRPRKRCKDISALFDSLDEVTKINLKNEKAKGHFVYTLYF